MDKVAAYLAMDPPVKGISTMNISQPVDQAGAMASLDTAQTNFLEVMQRALGLQSSMLDTQAKQAEEVKQAIGDKAASDSAKATAMASAETAKKFQHDNICNSLAPIQIR